MKLSENSFKIERLIH